VLTSQRLLENIARLEKTVEQQKNDLASLKVAPRPA